MKRNPFAPVIVPEFIPTDKPNINWEELMYPQYDISTRQFIGDKRKIKEILE